MSGVDLRPRTGLAWCLLASILLAAPAVFAQSQDPDPHAHHRQMMQEQAQQKSAGKTAAIRIPDVSLITQHGDTVNLRSDVVAAKIVVIDFVYTTCTTICPVLSAILGQVQGQLADRLGKEVVIVSVTVDPLRDTPARLKAYSEKHRARDGWLWLTGSKQNVDGVLKELGVYTPSFEDHPSTILVGDGSTGEWSRFIGFPGAGQLMDKINEFSAARMLQSAVRE